METRVGGRRSHPRHARGLLVIVSTGLAAIAPSQSLDWSRARELDGRSGHALVFDQVRGRTVLFGGLDSGLEFPSDVWEWNGTNWTPRQVPMGPTPRMGHAMAYDTARGRTVLFGGANRGGLFGDTWEWDGANWTQANPPVSPSRRSAHAMAYDAARQRVVLFGGRTAATWMTPGSGTAGRGLDRLRQRPRARGSNTRWPTTPGASGS